MFDKITPNIMVADVNATVDYYKNNLNFKIAMGVNENGEVKTGDSAIENKLVWALIKKDNVEIMLQEKDSFFEEISELKEFKMGGTFSLYINVKDLKIFYNQVKDKVKVIRDMHKTFYGTDEFVIRDINGYVIYFAESSN